MKQTGGKRLYVQFNELNNGDIFIAFDQLFIKFDNAVPGSRLNMQLPNCYNLSKNHYAVLGAEARCVVQKSILDFELPLEFSKGDLV